MDTEETRGEIRDQAFRSEMEKLIAEAQGGMAPKPALQEAGSAGNDMALDAIKRSVLSSEKTLVQLRQTLQSIDTKLGGVEVAHKELAQGESSSRKLFDALHHELQAYKDDFLFDALQKPVIRDLISLLDDLEQSKEQLQQTAEQLEHSEPLNIAVSNAENATHHLIEILQRLDVTRREPSEGLFDKRLHKAVSTVPTDDASLDGTIKSSLRPGYTWRNDRTLRPEEVTIFRFSPLKKAAAVTEEPQEEQDAPALESEGS